MISYALFPLTSIVLSLFEHLFGNFQIAFIRRVDDPVGTYKRGGATAASASSIACRPDSFLFVSAHDDRLPL
jgi:hypothetical protein